MKILIMGAGAVGLFYGARLQQAGEDVYYCARGENLRVLREHGLEVKSFQGDFQLAGQGDRQPARVRALRADPVLRQVLRHDRHGAPARRMPRLRTAR